MRSFSKVIVIASLCGMFGLSVCAQGAAWETLIAKVKKLYEQGQ